MRGARLILAFAFALTALAAGLVAAEPPALLPQPAVAQTGLTFAELAALAGNAHPDVKIARAAVIAAQGRFIQAGLYFNPIVGYYGSELNTKPNGAGKEGISFNQQIVTANKLGLAQAAASKGIAAADFVAITRYFDVVSRLRAAYFDAVAAQREVQVNEDLIASPRAVWTRPKSCPPPAPGAGPMSSAPASISNCSTTG